MKEDAQLLDFCSLFVCWMCACDTDEATEPIEAKTTQRNSQI